MKLLVTNIRMNRKYVTNLENIRESKIIIAIDKLNSKDIKVNDQTNCTFRPTKVPPARNITIKLIKRLVSNVIQHPKNLPTK